MISNKIITIKNDLNLFSLSFSLTGHISDIIFQIKMQKNREFFKIY